MARKSLLRVAQEKQTKQIWSGHAAPRHADLSSSQNGEENREEITRMEYVNSGWTKKEEASERASELVRAQRGSREKDKTKKKAAKIG